MSQSLFGWDLLYSSVENDMKSNQDVLVCLTHLVLVSNGFRCIGLGESKILDGSESKSEALPKNWNNEYAIRYVYQGRLYNFKASILEDGVMINLIRVDERTTSLVQLNSRSVAQRSGSLDEMIPDNKNISEQIKTQLIDKIVVSKKSKEGSSQTDTVYQDRRRSSPQILTGPQNMYDPRARVDYMPDLVGVGRRDLDPFADMDPLRVPNRNIQPGIGGGGGMLFNPPGPSFPGGGNLGVPPGSIPPGARFDPFRPPEVERFPPRRPPNRPDNDEFPPPGYDDMFM